MNVIRRMALTLLAILFTATPSLAQGLYGAMAPRAGQKAPDFKGKDLEGREIRLENYRGKPVLVIFWATWCGPCLQRIPDEIALRNAFTEDELAIIAVSTDERESTVRDFARSRGLNFTVVWDEGSRIAAQYSAYTLPTMYVLDRDGIIINEETLMSPAMVDALVEALVRKGADEARALVKQAKEEMAFLDEASQLHQWGDLVGYRDKLVEFTRKFPDSTWNERIHEVIASLNRHLGDESAPPTEAVTTVAIGGRIGTLELTPSSGEAIAIADPPGRPIVFTYWATDNPRSVEDQKTLRERQEALARTDLLVISVNLDADEKKAADHLKNNAIGYPLIRDTKRFDARLARLFGVKQIPSSALIAPDGRLVATDLYGERLQQGIDLLLAEKNADLAALHRQDQEERALISQSEEAWKAGDKGRFYDLLQRFTERYPDSPYTPRIRKVLEQNAEEVREKTGLRSFRRGDPVPSFILEDADGNEIRLAHYAGRPLLLAFIAPWSVPSHALARELAALRTQYSTEDLEILAVERVAESTGAAALFDPAGQGIPVARERAGESLSVARQFGVQSLPDLFLIDAKGRLLARHLGGPLLSHAAALAVEGKTDELHQFLQRAAEADEMLRDAEVALREYGRDVYVGKLRAFLEKYPDHHLAPKIGRIVSANSAEEDLSEYEALVAKSRGIRQAQKDFRILQWAMAEYRANYGGYPESLDRLADEDEGLLERLNDPFGKGRYRYGTDGKSYWIIVSNGPDGAPDINERDFSGDTVALASLAFDTDGGTEGSGDLYIASQ